MSDRGTNSHLDKQSILTTPVVLQHVKFAHTEAKMPEYYTLGAEYSQKSVQDVSKNVPIAFSTFL